MPEIPRPCDAWDDDLSALLDGELSPGREAEVREHLPSCAGCSARLAALRRVDEMLGATPLPEVSDALRDALIERAASARPSARRAAPPGQRRRWLAPPAVGIAAAAAAALALYLVTRPGPQSSLESPAPRVPAIAASSPRTGSAGPPTPTGIPSHPPSASAGIWRPCPETGAAPCSAIYAV